MGPVFENSEPSVKSIKNSFVNNLNPRDSFGQDVRSGGTPRNAVPSPLQPPMPPASWSQQQGNNDEVLPNVTNMRQSRTNPQFISGGRNVSGFRNDFYAIRTPRWPSGHPNSLSNLNNQQLLMNEWFSMNPTPMHNFPADGVDSQTLQTPSMISVYQNPAPYYAPNNVNFMPLINTQNWSNEMALPPYFIQTQEQSWIPPQHQSFSVSDFCPSEPTLLDPLQHHFYRDFYEDAYMNVMGHLRPPR